MVTLSNGKVKRSESEWRSVMAKYRQSGMSQGAFCEQEGISVTSFQNWRRRLGRDEAPRANFIEMVQQQRGDGGMRIELELPHGIKLVVRGE